MRGQLEPVYVGDKENLQGLLANLLHGDDVIMTQGAGNIGQIAAELAAKECEPKNFLDEK